MRRSERAKQQAVWEAQADAVRALAARAIGTLDPLLDADDARVRLAAMLKATALQNAGRPGGSTRAAAIPMDGLLWERRGVRA